MSEPDVGEPTVGDSPQRWDRQRIALIAAAVAAVLFGAAVPAFIALAGRTSSASFADTEVLATNRLGAAVLDLEVVDPGPIATPGGDGREPSVAMFSAVNLAPGDSVSGQLELRNAGDLPLRFGVSATTDGGALANWLRFEAWTGTTICAPGQPGARLAENVRLSTASTVLVDPRSRPEGNGIELQPGASVILCLGADLALDTPNEAQGRSLDLTLVLVAEQLLEDGA